MKYRWNPLLRDEDLFALDYTPRSSCNVAFPYRMGAGFIGDVGRFHPSATIEPNKMSPTAPPLGFGLAVVIESATQSVRQMAAGDTAVTSIYGITVRPYPFQGSVPSSSAYGGVPLGTPAVPVPGEAIDVMRAGYVMVKAVGTPKKGDPVFVWIAASGAGHTQGSFETAASAGNTIALDAARVTWGSGPDADGVAELAFNL